ncbi:MAG TPA: phenylalanine--tRNA ligase subunit beta [Clostridiaceae bacterium]|nr:phenylalanine--tRNA ligase subunit beta [Clostridiaceae bacterium]
MKASLEWIKDFAEYQGNLNEFVDGMTMSGTKVESVEHEGAELKNIVVGHVLEKTQHPNADRLSICQVDVGTDVLQIICGAPNVAAGQKVIVAVPGAVLAGGFKIKKAKMRGEESNGMICSIDELGFSIHEFPDAISDGIYVLPDDAPIGGNALDVIGIGQEIIEFEITSNRPDCLAVEGLARETAVTFDTEFAPLDKKPSKFSDLKSEDLASIVVEAPDLCPAFIGRVVTDVKIEPSPIWLQKRLRAAGMRPINNIVDITNFVMLSLGQPMHAYDLDFLTDQSIIVRRAKEQEEMTLLDGTEIKMNPADLVIADTAGAVGLAGVMGAENSEVRDSTKAILFEAANFSKISVRKTAKDYNLRSEASLRFEKGLPAQNAQRAMDYACYLIEELNCGKVACTEIKVAEQYPELHKIKYTAQGINKLTGIDLSIEQINQILSKLELIIEPTEISDIYSATIPCFRDDLKLEADLAEEVARIYGYDKIESRFSKGNTPTLGGRNARQLDIEKVRRILEACGAYEAYTYSFVSPTDVIRLGLNSDHALSQQLTILNPLGEEYSKMRTTILPSLLRVIEYNSAHGNSNGIFYELGKTYHPLNILPDYGLPADYPDEHLPDERDHITIALFDQNLKDSSQGYFELKGIMEELFRHLGIARFKVVRAGHNYPYYHPGQAASIYLPDYNESIGIIGTIHPSVAKEFEITPNTYILDLELKPLLQAKREEIVFQALPKYPAINRDLAFVMPQENLVSEIETEIADLAGDLLESIKIFDVYQGEGIAEDKKSVAFSLVFRAAERTLSDQEINPIMQKIITKMAEKNIILRG